MTDYTAWLNTLPSGTSSVSTGSRNDGLYFSVTQSGCTLTGIAFYVPSGETNLTGSNYTATLYSTTNGTSGTQVAQANGSGTFTAGAWNWIPFSSVSLSTGVDYVAAIHHPSNLQFKSNYWSGVASSDNGPLHIPSQASSPGTKQQPNLSGSTAFPTNANNPATFYGVDVQVTQTAGVSGTIAATLKKVTAALSGNAPLQGTIAVTLKKATVSISGSGLAPFYNTGTTAHAASVAQTTHPTLTIPSGVSVGDGMIVGVDLFGFTGDATGLTINLSPGVGGNNWTLLGVQKKYDDGALSIYGAVFIREASASDPGSTLTFSYSGTPGTDQKWWAISLGAWTRLDVSKIDVASVAGAMGSTTVPTPSLSTTNDGAWGIYIAPASPNGSGALTAGPSGTTLRQDAFDSGVNCGIADTNGPVGAAGTSIGGGTWASSGSGSGWYTSFTLAVAPKVTTVPNSISATLKKPQVSLAGKVTGTFSVAYSSSSGGIDTYNVTSQANGTGTHSLRVAVPTNPDPSYPHSFLYMLPVEADGGNTFGDPLAMAVSLGLHNTYNTTIVCPGYAIDPWFADNPSDTTIQQETHTIWVADWIKTNLAITGTESQYLIGFSKSGIGGAGLLFRHPQIFAKAALWDTPADTTAYDHFTGNSDPVYGTQANFANNYQLSSTNLTAWKAPFTSTNRLWVASGSSYGGEVTDWHNLMTPLGILHTYDGTTFASDTHAWHNDWILAGLASIFPQHTSIHVTLRKASVASSGTHKYAAVIAVTLKKVTASVSGVGKTSGTISVTLKKTSVQILSGLTGTISVTLKKPTGAISGQVTVPGSLNITLRKVTTSLTGSAFANGTISVTLKKLTVAVSGTGITSGTINVTLSKVTVFITDGHQHPASSLFIFSQL